VDPTIPKSLSRLIEKMMAKRREDRHQTARELLQDIELIKQGEVPLLKRARTKARKASGGTEQPGAAKGLAEPVEDTVAANEGQDESAADAGADVEVDAEDLAALEEDAAQEEDGALEAHAEHAEDTEEAEGDEDSDKGAGEKTGTARKSHAPRGSRREKRLGDDRQPTNPVSRLLNNFPKPVRYMILIGAVIGAAVLVGLVVVKLVTK
jgi:hypothetical protein